MDNTGMHGRLNFLWRPVGGNSIINPNVSMRSNMSLRWAELCDVHAVDLPTVDAQIVSIPFSNMKTASAF